MTVINPNRVFSVNTLLELLDEFEDETLEAVSDDALPDEGSLLVESQIQPFLEALPGRYWWHYNHEEYQDAEIVVVELEDPDSESAEATTRKWSSSTNHA